MKSHFLALLVVTANLLSMVQAQNTPSGLPENLPPPPKLLMMPEATCPQNTATLAPLANINLMIVGKILDALPQYPTTCRPRNPQFKPSNISADLLCPIDTGLISVTMARGDRASEAQANMNINLFCIAEWAQAFQNLYGAPKPRTAKYPAGWQWSLPNPIAENGNTLNPSAVLSQMGQDGYFILFGYFD